MHNFKGKMKAVSRRIAHLRTRLDSPQSNPRSLDYDRAEVTALSDLLRVATVYNDARGPDGSHVENTLYMVRDVLEDTVSTNSSSMSPDDVARLQTAWDKVNESIQVIRKLAEDVEKDS